MIYALIIIAVVCFPAVAMAGGAQNAIISIAKGTITHFLQGNLIPQGRNAALSLFFVAMTAVWLLSSKKSRAFTTIFGPIGLFFAIYRTVVGIGVGGAAKFVWDIAWGSGSILTGIAMVLMAVYLIQNFAMKIPVYFLSTITRMIGKTKELAKGVTDSGEKAKEPWPWIVMGSITLIGWIIDPKINEQNGSMPLIGSGLLCAFTLVYFLFIRKKVQTERSAPARVPAARQAHTPPPSPAQAPPVAATNLVTCPHCGSQEEPGNGCGNCGQPLTTAPNPTANPRLKMSERPFGGF